VPVTFWGFFGRMPGNGRRHMWTCKLWLPRMDEDALAAVQVWARDDFIPAVKRFPGGDVAVEFRPPADEPDP
jgi:hypothetical protein